MSVIDQIPTNLLAELLEETDEFAVENVKADRGGPFGASIHVYDLSNNELVQIGELEANAVLATGMGSAHAEDQALNPETISTLKSHLSKLSETSRPVIIFSSSGESCPACHSKEEILSRTLLEEGLINAGHFVVTYGATYKDTADIAGFNDAPYHADMKKPKGSGMIKIAQENIDDIPQEISQIFEKSQTPVAVIVQSDGTISAGYENRDHDLMATSEVSAIRNAASQNKQNGAQTPWDLGGEKEGATIYTSTDDVGPLGYAECQWANITNLVSVNHPKAKEWATQEAPGISNDDFFKVIASAENNNPESTLIIKQIQPFDNKAQHEWKNKEDRIIYNGIDID